MSAPSSFKFALACGTAGAWTEVTDDVLFNEGNIPYRWGRTSGFDQATRPGQYSFTLKNPAGKYSPANPLSTLATPLVEGMGANWEINGVQRAGTIRSLQVIFPERGLVNSARVRIVVEDMLGSAARHAIGDFADALWSAAGGLFLWRLNDATGATVATEANGGGAVSVYAGVQADATFGTTATSLPIISPVLKLVASSASGVGFSTGGSIATSLPVVGTYGTATCGAWSWWAQRGTLGFNEFTVGIGFGNNLSISLDSFGAQMILNAGSNQLFTSALLVDTAYHFAITSATTFAAGVWTIAFTLWINGVSVGSVNHSTTPATLTNSDRATSRVSFFVSGIGATAYLSRLTHSLTRINETPLTDTTAALRLPAIAATTPEITLDTVPTMSPATIGRQGGSTTLAAFEEVLRGEQGGIGSVTTGTLTAPVQKLLTYARDRKRAADLTISMNKIQGSPEFVRTLTNRVYRATASGPALDVDAVDATASAFVGTASTSDNVTLRDRADLYAYATDRIYRGKNVLTPIVSIQVDARSADLSIWSTLLALRPGSRVHITDTPTTQLGYNTWDGWVVGGDEVHTNETRSLFTIYMQQAWDVPVYGTARYTAGGIMTLQSTITSGSTSIGIVSTGDLFTTSGGNFPQNIQIGNEVITLSAVSGASSPQTGTISARGVGSVPAAAHTAGDAIELSPLARYDY